MIKSLFKHYNKHLIFSNHLMIVIFIFFEYDMEIKLDMLSYFYLLFLSPFFYNALNSENMWNPKINHLCSVSKGRLLFASNSVNIAYTLISFSLFLFVEAYQSPSFEFLNNLYPFFIKLLIAVLAGNFISITLSQYYGKRLYKILLGSLFFVLISIFFPLVQLLDFHSFIKIVALSTAVVILNFSQLKKTYFYYDFN